ncbi:hypothetical protein DHEL01_v205875 [Diaporthe helianthi]|uniref:C2H2-type domain-containing protein n=1 Tax=Diaporthe helianthi TaxID=158607 RepID=A0A2P5HZR6_DIAHE|nr:hypothetical protein DHEL01_v205875 [Diaporthe helianthi]
MEQHTNFASYTMTLDDIDQSEIEQMMQQIEWEQSMSQQATIGQPDYDTTTFEPTLSPLSGYASPSSMTTGSTNQSPLVPLLDYDMSYSLVPASDDPESLFPELMDYNTNMDPAWLGLGLGSQPEGFTGPFPASDDGQTKLPPAYPLLDSQLYMTAAPDQTPYTNNPSPATYLPTSPPPPPTTVQPQPPPPPPPTSSSQPSTTQQQQQPPPPTTTNPNLTCPHCSATFTEKTKLKVHTNKHTKPFRCTAPGCSYAAAEKKSLHRHLQGKSDYDGDHRAAARRGRVPLVKHRCPREKEGCTYATFRDDNLKRHGNTCTGR